MKIDEVIRDKHKVKEKKDESALNTKVTGESDSEFDDDQMKAEKLD